MRRKLLVSLGAVGAFTLLAASPAWAQGVPEEPETQYILDNIFIFIAAVLVIFMQAGFALLEAGLTRSKNVANIMMKNLMDFSIAGVLFFLVGFAFAFGSDAGGLIGTDGFALSAGAFDQSGLQVETQFIFQVAFAGAAATIASGAMAERTKFKSYVIFSAVMTAFIYPVVVHWFWGGGWIADLEISGRTFGDFAGSTIVHSTGGWAALMGAILLGPRIGKYGPDGKPRAIPGHSIPFAVLGVFILWIGWYGFNPGSELAADTAVVPIAVTTTLAAAAGALTATATIWFKSGKPDVAMAGNGVLAGLVGITAGTGALDNWGALITGALAGVLVVFSVITLDRLKIDDPVGAVSVHAICGVWGTLAVGFFATKEDGFVTGVDAGLFYGGGISQLIVQIIGIVGVAAWTIITTGIVFSVLKATIGLRVSEEEEIEGLDVLEHGAPGYSGDVVAGVSGSSPSAAPVA